VRGRGLVGGRIFVVGGRDSESLGGRVSTQQVSGVAQLGTRSLTFWNVPSTLLFPTLCLVEKFG
jgi:hypothetical protein